MRFVVCTSRRESRIPRREYAAGAEVRRLHGEGQLYLDGRRWDISRALAGEWVELTRVEGRILVYYCRSLVRELGGPPRWTAGCAPPRKCKECPDNTL